MSGIQKIVYKILWLYAFAFLLIISGKKNEFCEVDSKCKHLVDNSRYLLYDINPPEGFNLRRDVYMRFAVLFHKLQKSNDPKLKNFKLVLPPWSHLVHWKYNEEPEHVPWSVYFDLHSMQKFAPVIEMSEFFQAPIYRYKSQVQMDEVYILQNFEDMFETGNFEDKMKIEKCQRHHQLNYFYYNNFTADTVQCLSFHGAADKLQELFLNTTADVLLLHHSEVVLHEMFGNSLYWQARRSMRFNKNLQEIAHDFRKNYLNSSDKNDDTNIPKDWMEEKPRRNAKGGDYLSVHLRRGDFVRGRTDQVPSLPEVARQILKLLKDLDLNNVFIASDASEDELNKIANKLRDFSHNVVRFRPKQDFLDQYKDGGVAIIDQIVCSHARYFIGTQESTFSFRIQEEREILGFPIDTTFNSLCKNETHCVKSSVWKIAY